DVLRRARQCAPSELGAFLLAELLGRDQATVEAIMDQLTAAEGAALDAHIGPEPFAFMETLPASELEAITRGDPIALQRVWPSYQRWRKGRAGAGIVLERAARGWNTTPAVSCGWLTGGADIGAVLVGTATRSGAG